MSKPGRATRVRAVTKAAFSGITISREGGYSSSESAERSFQLRVKALNGELEDVQAELERAKRINGSSAQARKWVNDARLPSKHNSRKQRALSRELCDGLCTAIWLGAFNGHTAVVRSLLKAGADHRPNTAGQTPLFAAATGGHVDAAKVLVRAGAEVDAATSEGWTPLHIATLHEHEVSEQLWSPPCPAAQLSAEHTAVSLGQKQS